MPIDHHSCLPTSYRKSQVLYVISFNSASSDMPSSTIIPAPVAAAGTTESTTLNITAQATYNPSVTASSTETLQAVPKVPRSPSPPPSHPPQSSHTPGPRAQALNSIFSSALSHTISTCSYANFAACFPTPARAAPQILESVWRQVTRMIEEKSRREFEEILVERNVVEGLGELERVVGDAKARREKESKTDGVPAKKMKKADM